MQERIYVTVAIVLTAFVIFFMIFRIVSSIKKKFYKNKVKNLEVFRNKVASTPVLVELSKIEPIIKNEKMEEKYNKWEEKFNKIKDDRISLIDDMLIDLDDFVDKKDYKSCGYRMAKVEIEIYKVREAAEHLLEEIRDVTLSEEKYRSIVTKLKTKYRTLNKEFQDHRELYESMQEEIGLQLENIERRFLDFEKIMDANDYNEVVHIVKALDTMIEHMDIIVNEVPDVLLMANQIIPNRMAEVERTYNEMIDKGYQLDYLNIEYNLKESKKTINSILDRVKVLDLEGSMFDLRTMLEYYDSLFIDFEKERLSKKVYEEEKNDFAKKIEKTNKLVNDIYLQLDDIKKMYDLNDEDVKIIDEVNKILIVINDDYKKMLAKDETKSTPFSALNEEIESLTVRLKNMEEEFDKALKSLGNMYDDEVRAREQLDEIQDLLKQCKNKIRSYKLPVITDSYFVQLSEANEAIEDVIKELEVKPIVIKTLNTRVDTARDLVLKLLSTTNEMIKTAKLAEMAIVYVNRYRLKQPEIDSCLTDAEIKFYKGEYRNSFDIVTHAAELVDDSVKRRILEFYEK